MDHIVVTGGAGYIGSHACKALRERGFIPVTLDNLISGWRDAVKYGPFENGDLVNKQDIERVFKKYRPVGVMHFAACSQVGESVNDPAKYWRNNLLGSLNLFEVCVAQRCLNVVFSSTCATYGEHDNIVLDEETKQFPSNPYGATKRSIEEMLQHFNVAYGLKHVIFRYFNVAGADPEGEIGEFHQPETHLIPLILDAIDGKRDDITIFGTDYATADGTCIRDYVHVCDLVEAHILGLKWLMRGGSDKTFNLGTGVGFSVREVINHAGIVTNRDVTVIEGKRRAGDCTKLVSGSELARRELGWEPKRSSLKQMITDAWRWHQTDGYQK